MKKRLKIILVLIIGYAPFSSAQEYFVPKAEKKLTFSRLNSDYFQNQSLLMNNEDDWYQPDTIIHYRHQPEHGDLRKLYFYNENGFLVNILYHTNTTGSWVNSRQYTYEYDSKGNLLSELYQEFINNAWQNDYIDEFTYNSKNKVTKILCRVWESSNTWRDYEQYSYDYDERSNLISELSQSWSKYENIWEDDYQYLYTYDSNNNMLTALERRLKNDILTDDCRYTYSYDDINNMETQLREYYNSNGNQWLNSDYILLTYYSNNNLKSYLYQMWNYSYWIDIYRISYEYDDNDNQTSYIQESYNNVWNYSEKKISTYYNNNCVSETLFNWKNNDWEYKSRILNEYNNNNLINVIFQGYETDWYDYKKRSFEYSDGNCISAESFILNGENWESYNDNFSISYNSNERVYNVYYTYKIDLSYTKTPKPAGIENHSKSISSFIVYPNPTSEELKIKNEELKIIGIEVYNVTGKKQNIRINSGLKQSETVVNVSNLQNGVYFVKIQTESGSAMEKFVKN
ncbi:MAG: T9SS type A sorting domain-containing protein [Bacteroidales bacterium]|jgi:hypothetical protein|nr:T9SS type A sorting domain-containing protein [Bacteroidales bacterium]